VSQVKVGSAGPQPAKILLIGEAPGKSEEEECKPFVGSSGIELSKMLNDAGILRTECRVTNVCKYRPPGNKMELWWPKKDKNGRQIKSHIVPSMRNYDGNYFDPRVIEGLEELKEEIAATKPNVIVPLGNLPLWATTRNSGITKWRSSLLRPHPDCVSLLSSSEGIKVIPTIHPAAILRKWDWRYLAVHDFRRVKRWESTLSYPEIEENFLVKPDYGTCISTLEGLLRRVQADKCKLAVDIETSRRHLACFGIAWSSRDAISIPFLSASTPDRNYWTEEEEVRIVLLLRDLLTHSNAECIGQNWQYDGQYIAKYWGFEVNLFLDIMSEHHVHFPGLPKGLDFQSSMYSDIHVYWKDEGKEMGKGDEVQWWIYNCKDCVRTYEIATVLLHARSTTGLKSTSYGSPHDIQQRLSRPIARASMRGVRVDHNLRRRTAFMLQENVAEAERWLERILGQPFNCRSPKQMAELFYGELQQSKILHRKTKKPTLEADALDIISKRDVLLRPLCQGINNIRSLSNSFAVCLQPLDADGRFRCQYTIPGAETYRFASSSDPFGFGTNAQNLTSGERAEADYPMPNLRRWLVPDPGCAIGELDFPQADARVVAWEAEDEDLIALFLDPSRHLHMENAEIIFGKRPLSKHEPNYYYAKQGVHLTNYGGQPTVLAKTLGITMQEAERFNKRWFEAHPKIREWQRKIESRLMTHRYVENAFGYRRFYFDRMEGLLKEALAWIPQSTVAIATNLGLLAIDEDPQFRATVELLLQTHDSTTWQWPSSMTDILLPQVLQKATIEVPYARPLILKPEAKLSLKSWGDVESYTPATMVA